MAQTFSININLLSVDNTGSTGLASGTEYTATNASLFQRGHYTITPTVIVSINDDNQASFSWGSYTGDASWYVCSQNGYHIDIEFSTDNVNWQTISSAFVNNSATQSCDGVYKTWEMVRDLVNNLAPAQLTSSGYLRINTWTLHAAPTYTSDDYFPYAYPNQAASQVVAAGVDIKLDYRPGETYDGTAYMSHNRSDGVCEVHENGAWTSMRTDGYPTAKGNPPEVYHNGTYFNMGKTGQEA